MQRKGVSLVISASCVGPMSKTSPVRYSSVDPSCTVTVNGPFQDEAEVRNLAELGSLDRLYVNAHVDDNPSAGLARRGRDRGLAGRPRACFVAATTCSSNGACGPREERVKEAGQPVLRCLSPLRREQSSRRARGGGRSLKSEQRIEGACVGACSRSACS